MKAYGIKLQDLGRSCTSVSKYGSDRLVEKCSCGKRHCRKAKDHKERKAKERHSKIEE